MVRRTVEEAQATRRRLLETALDTFSSRGYRAATLEEIASRAGVTRGALYHHFDDKADLYDAMLREEADQVMRPLMARLSGDQPPLERLRRFFVSYCAAMERDPKFRAVLGLLLFGGGSAPERSGARTREGYRVWTKMFESVLDEAHRRGELRAGVRPREAALAFVALAGGVTTMLLQAPGLLSPSRDASRLFDAMLNGIGT